MNWLHYCFSKLCGQHNIITKIVDLEGTMDCWNNILDEEILKFNVNFSAMFVLNYKEILKELNK